MRRRAVGVLLVLLALPPGASAQAPPLSVPTLPGFRSVLAQGEGQQLNAIQFGAYTADESTLPSSFTNQQPLYVGIMPRAASLQAPDLDRFYRDGTFGALPGGVSSRYSPRPGVTVIRDGFHVAHVYGDSRADVMFGVGYATAEERLFAMDVLRHVAKGRLAELTGPGAAEMDAAQLTDQNFTDEELRAQAEALPRKFGAAGERGLRDVQDYIAGINARIADARTDPNILPAEYPALNVMPKDWDISDSVAMAVLLVTQFTVSNGGEERNAEIRQEFRKRFGRKWRARFEDFRNADNPETYTVAAKRHLSDRPGKRRRGVNLVPDLGSVKRFNPQVEGPGAAQAAAAGWVREVQRIKSRIPRTSSNAVLVSGKLSKSGKPLFAAGPQVSYYSPQIFVEYELHGGGVDGMGVSFPGASPWPLIGHGTDFAWSGTSANGDNNDTFVETLCEPDGSDPTERSRHYRYRGECIPFFEREVRMTTPPPSAGNQEPQQEIVHKPLRSVHGPVFALGTVGGKPVALTKAKGVNFRELDAVLPFMHVAENQPTDYRSFFRTFSPFPGTENWFYADDRNTGFIQSGYYPAHAKGADVDLPMNGDGTGDWQGFDPATYDYRHIPLRQRPRAVDTGQPIIISWNQKEAPGWRKGPTEWSDGSAHHAELLLDYLRTEIKAGGGKTDLVGITKAANQAATTDLRGMEVYPWLRRMIGRASAGDARHLELLDAWNRAGSHRLDEDGDNLYEHGAAVALMDSWWPLLVRASFEPALGEDLFAKVEDRFLSLPAGGLGGWDWASHVEKDLRTILGRRVRGKPSRTYCGGSSRRRAKALCRELLVRTLREAVAATAEKQGSADPADWKVPATCPKRNPAICDQEVPTALGAVDTPPFPWQNRGTYHQVVELTGRR